MRRHLYAAGGAPLVTLFTAAAIIGCGSSGSGDGDDSEGSGAPAEALAAASPFSLATGDIDDDGNMDVVTANFDTNNVSVLMGQGDGTFADAMLVDVGEAPRDVKLLQLNETGIFSDPDLDLLVANSASENISIKLGDGLGGFGADVGEGDLDTEFVGSNPSTVGAADLDDDGFLDYFAADFERSRIFLRRGSAFGPLSPLTTIIVGSAPRGMVIDDIDGDGDPDVVTANLLSDTLAVLADWVRFCQPCVPFVPASAQQFFLRVDSDTRSIVGSSPRAIATADLNGDGDTDAVTTHRGLNAVGVSLGNGTRMFDAAVTFDTPQNPESIAIDDVNGDGDLDLVTTNGSPTGENISVLLGDGTGTFADPINITTSDVPIPLGLADFNNDGDLDIVVANIESHDVSVFLGNGDGTFGAEMRDSIGND